MTHQAIATIVFMLLALTSSPIHAAPRVSHHGGLIIHCEPPHFFDPTPGKEAKVTSIQDFSLTASDNTDQATIKVWANNEPVIVAITQQRSGSFLINGHFKEPVTQGKVWFRVNAESNDGCDDNFTWNVYTGG